jgi:predicted MFS family arabinose efflux permease
MTFGSIVLGLAAEYWGYATLFALAGFVVLSGLFLFTLGTRNKSSAENSWATG